MGAKSYPWLLNITGDTPVMFARQSWTKCSKAVAKLSKVSPSAGANDPISNGATKLSKVPQSALAATLGSSTSQVIPL
jgi:hypothetical protein